MPKAIQADWELIKALFLQGFTQSQIAARTGVKPVTIKSRAARYGWSLLRRQANGALNSDPGTLAHQGLAQLAQEHQKALVKASSEVQQAFSGEVQAQVALLKKNAPRKLADLANTPRREGRASVVKKLVETADKLYGWSAQDATPSTLNLTQVNVSHVADVEPGTKLIDTPSDE